MKKVLFYIVLLLLLLPMFFGLIQLVTEKPLDGAFISEQQRTLKYFTWERWFNDAFQLAMEKTASQKTGLRNTLIRIYNQINFSLFQIAKAEKTIVGKDNYLFEEGYIIDYLGRNYLGEKFILENSLRMKIIQDSLKQKFGIHLLFVFEPGKASVYPEKIGKEYFPELKMTSNYEQYAHTFSKENISFLDINAYFKAVKDTAQYPVYPATGVHWSTYGMYLAADTLLKYIKHQTSYDLPQMQWKNIGFSNKLKDVDFDLEKPMNLLFQIPHQTLAYPEVMMDTAGKFRPHVLAIADSYYWSLYDNKIPHLAFANTDFWYYNNTIYPNIWGENADYVNAIDYQKVIEKQNVILVMITEANMYRAFWKLEERFEPMLNIQHKTSKHYNKVQEIMFNDGYYKALLEFTRLRFMAFDEALGKF